MVTLYKGAGPGTYWHSNSPYDRGFLAHNPGAQPSNASIINHIGRGVSGSPYISFTRSFGVARAYALHGCVGIAHGSDASPGYVYEIEVPDDTICKLIDPVVEIAKDLPMPYAKISYHHDGDPNFLLGVVDPFVNKDHLIK